MNSKIYLEEKTSAENRKELSRQDMNNFVLTLKEGVSEKTEKKKK